MTSPWTPDQLERIEGSDELEIATTRANGTVRRYLPIWAVRVGADVYVRTWHRRDSGWFGHAVASGRALVRLPGVAVEVTVEDVGDGEARVDVDAAYRSKYGRYGDGSVERMVSDDAAAATLRLTPR